MISLLFLAQVAVAEEKTGVVDRIQSARASISETEKEQREALGNLFIINRHIKEIAKRAANLNARLMNQEANVRSMAQEVSDLENKSGRHQILLNKRLRQLYQEQRGTNFQWLFTAQTPVEAERNHRFLKLMIDSDHRHLKKYLVSLRELREKRARLKALVAGLARTQKEVQAQEAELGDQMRAKSRLLAELKKTKDSRLSELRDLRHQNADVDEALSYAFFERKGVLRPPLDNARLVREYGTFVDPTFRFRLMHKGLFYGATAGTTVHSVFDGRVAVAAAIPGFGKAVVVDHGDNYYSVYAFVSQLKIKEGAKVREGDVLALSGEKSPLFGPGLYFEIRHFTDAVDPRPWIKESLIKTAEAETSN